MLSVLIDEYEYPQSGHKLYFQSSRMLKVAQHFWHEFSKKKHRITIYLCDQPHSNPISESDALEM